MIRWCKTHENTGYDGAEVCDRYWHPAWNVGGENTCEFVDAVVLVREPCPNCNGTGTVHKDKPGIRDDYPFPCPYCKGEGCDAAWCDERHPGPRNNDGSLVVQEGTDT